MGEDSLERIEQLEARVLLLESYLRGLQSKIADDTTSTSSAAWKAPSPIPPAWPAPEPASATRITRPSVAIGSETLLKWGGVGLVVLAVGFAVNTAISRGWIGPQLQLAGALTIAFALAGVGIRLRTSRPGWTHALCSGGVLALVTTFASDLFLEEANDEVAFGATAVAGATGLALARFVRSEWVGSVTVVGTAIGWFVIADGEPPFVSTMSFIVAFAAIGILISLDMRWHAVRLVVHAVAMIEVFGMATEVERAGERPLVFAACGLLAVSLVLVPSIGDLDTTWQQLEVQLTIVAPAWVLSVIAVALELDGRTPVGVTAAMVTATTVVAALAARRWIEHAHLVSLMIGASITLSIGMAALLSTTAAFAALAVQGAGLVVLSRSFGGSARVLINAATLIGIAGVVTTVDMIETWADEAPIADGLAHLVVIVAIAVAAWQSRHQRTRELGALLVLALVLIWLGSVLVHLPQGQAAVSVAWAIIGTAVLVTGAVRRRTDIGMVGLAVLALTVGKLLTVDLQEVDTLWRAGLFLVVGLGFLRLGFLLPRLAGDDTDAEN